MIFQFFYLVKAVNPWVRSAFGNVYNMRPGQCQVSISRECFMQRKSRSEWNSLILGRGYQSAGTGVS